MNDGIPLLDQLKRLEQGDKETQILEMAARVVDQTNLHEDYVRRVQSLVEETYKKSGRGFQNLAICEETERLCLQINKEEMGNQTYWFLLQELETVKERLEGERTGIGR